MADVKLWNKGKATIFGHHSDVIDQKTGKNKAYAFPPETAQAFSEKDANKLRRLYKRTIVSMDDIKRQFDEKPSSEPVEDTSTHISIDEAERQKQEAVTLAVNAEKARIAEELRKFGLHDGAARIAGEVEADSQISLPPASGVADEAPAVTSAPEKKTPISLKGFSGKR